MKRDWQGVLERTAPPGTASTAPTGKKLFLRSNLNLPWPSSRLFPRHPRCLQQKTTGGRLCKYKGQGLVLSGPGCCKTGTRMVLLVVCTSAAMAVVQRRGCWADPARLQARWCSVLRHLQGNTGTYVRLSFDKGNRSTATFLSVHGHSHISVTAWHSLWPPPALQALAPGARFSQAPLIFLGKSSCSSAVLPAVGLRAAGVSLLTFTKNTHLKAHPDVQVSVQGFQCNFTRCSVELTALQDQREQTQGVEPSPKTTADPSKRKASASAASLEHTPSLQPLSFFRS